MDLNLTLFDAQTVGTVLIQGLLAFVFIGGLWALVDKFTHFNDYDEIVVNKNWRYLVQRIGMLLAQTGGIMACFSLSGKWSSVGIMALGSAWVTIVLMAIYFLIERVLGRRTRQQDSHMDNMGVSLAKASAYLVVGFVLNGSLSGSAPDPTTAIAATVIFTLLGLVSVPIGIYLHNRGLSYNLTKEAREGKLPAALELSGILLALGIILRNAIAGDFVGWAPGLVGFGITLGIGWLLLYAYRVIAGKIVFHHCNVNNAQREDAVGVSALLAVLLPTIALIVSMVVTPIAGVLA